MKPTTCPGCNEESLYINEGISKKTGKPYKNEKCSKCGYLKWIDIKQPAQNSGNDIILETLQEEFKKLNERFDSLATYLAGKLK